MRIIETSIARRTSVPWDEVQRKESMRGTKSNISEELALRSEIYVPPIPRYVSRKDPGAPMTHGESGMITIHPPHTTFVESIASADKQSL